MKIVCDAMLGKLAKYLRILGLDAGYTRDVRILMQYQGSSDPPYFLTRSTRKPPYDRTILIRSDKVRDQLQEIKEFIQPFIDPGTVMNRCIECNVELADVEKKDIEQKVPEFIFHRYRLFRICTKCGKVYWEGSHTTGMASLVREIVSPEGGRAVGRSEAEPGQERHDG